MLRTTAFLATFALALAPLGCGSDDPDDTPDSGTSSDGAGNADASTGADASADGFSNLITGSWTIPPNSETYWCVRLTVQEDIYITGFRDLSPIGTHHTVLSVRNSDGSGSTDGEFPCNAGTGSFDPGLLFASGVGTDDFLFPQGVAVRIQAGQQLTLNLHLYNVDDSEITGTSGTMVRTVDASEVTDIAEMVFGGTSDFTIPPSGSPYSASGSCTFTQPATLLNLWPHMHQSGIHMLVEHQGNTLLDTDFSFNEQVNYPMMIQIGAGESLDVTCTWINQTGSPIGFGDSSEQEMCFAGFYRYPAQNQGLFCGVL